MVDKVGSVYVAGQSQGLGTGSDIVLIKYNPDGDEVWVRRFNGPTNGYDTPSDEVGGKCIAMDSLANIYSAGTSRNITGAHDYVTLMYDSIGNQKWAAFYDGADTIDYALALDVNASGDVYVCGRSLSPVSYYDWAKVKYRTVQSKIEKIKPENFVFNFRAFPNPLKSNVKISYSSREPIHLIIRIYDISGRLVKNLVNKNDFKGNGNTVWNCEDTYGKRVNSGVYFCVLKSLNQTVVFKLVVVDE